MNTWKEDSALRIMEALSGVDEELLERCEHPASVKKKKIAKISERSRLMRRVGRVCAACMCLAVLGAAYRVSTLRMGSAGDNMSGSAKSGEALLEVEEQEVYEPETAGREDKYMEEGTTEAAAGYDEPCWLDIDMLLERASSRECLKEGMINDTSSQQLQLSGNQEECIEIEDDNTGEIPENAEIPVSRAAVSWENVYSVTGLGDYVPVEWPEGYMPLTVEQNKGTDERNNLLLTWRNQEHILWLKLTETELNADMLYESEEAVFAAGEDWRSKIPEPEADGSIQFALLYEDGVLMEYKGWLTVSEIIELFGE